MRFPNGAVSIVMLYSQLEIEVFNHLRAEITKKADVILTYEMPVSLRENWADILIYTGDHHVAIIDVKGAQDISRMHQAEQKLRAVAFNQGYQFAIITNNEDYLLWELKEGPSGEFRKIALEDLVGKFETIKSVIDQEEKDIPHAKDFKNAVNKLVEKHFQDDNARANRIKDFVKNCQDIDFIVKGGKLQFFDVKKENQFFEQLIEMFDEDEIYRYTSLDSLYLTLSTGQQGMCSLIGMNDKSEVNYADDYLELSDGKTAYDKKKENNFFILSCVEEDSQEQESLTMWRLYGDKTEGVRITYQRAPMTDGFKFGKIYYGTDKDKHPGLDFVKAMQTTKMGNVYFRFKHLDYWKHFFKHYDYSIEKEVRLLYEKTNSNMPAQIKWIKGGEYGILIPLALFNEVTFPLNILKIHLGPNMKEHETNLLQIQMLVEEKGILPISSNVEDNVKESRIKHYRI